MLLTLLLAAVLLLLVRRSLPAGPRPPTLVTVAEAGPTPTFPPSPVPTPSPLPEPAFSFLPDPDSPLPEENGVLSLGEPFLLGGRVQSNLPLLNVSVFILCDYSEDERYPVERSVSFDPAAGVTSYDLGNADTLEGTALNAIVPFEQLTAGHHHLYLFARAMGQVSPKPVCEINFDVLSEEWERIAPAQFSNGTYETALAFFGGDESALLYRYQWVYQRYIIAQRDWEEANIVELTVDEGEPWRINKAAISYYERVRDYLNTVHFRVHGTNGDTGVLPLTRCIESYSGSYCSRFTSSMKRISHHAFGTASDVNATLAPNENRKENIDLIRTEVQDKLVYNGILVQDGVSYYDFTYSGGYQTTRAGVPETVLNYLLYELAFYRAGFQWGHYYNSTSDGMHFTLTDNLSGRHDRGSRALRKVYEYCA